MTPSCFSFGRCSVAGGCSGIEFSPLNIISIRRKYGRHMKDERCISWGERNFRMSSKTCETDDGTYILVAAMSSQGQKSRTETVTQTMSCIIGKGSDDTWENMAPYH
jgi:hypothetical protein